MNFAAATGHRLGRATPCLRDTPQRKLMGTTGRRSTYRRRNAVQANPATSERAQENLSDDMPQDASLPPKVHSKG